MKCRDILAKVVELCKSARSSKNGEEDLALKATEVLASDAGDSGMQFGAADLLE